MLVFLALIRTVCSSVRLGDSPYGLLSTVSVSKEGLSGSAEESLLYGIQPWKLVEAVSAASKQNLTHGKRIVDLDQAVACTELPYTVQLLNMNLEKCTVPKVNRIIKAWLQGDYSTRNTNLELLVDEFSLGEMFHNGDMLFTNKVVADLGLIQVMGYWDTWPSPGFYKTLTKRHTHLVVSLSRLEIGEEDIERELVRRNLLYFLEVGIEGLEKWFLHDISPSLALTEYARQFCSIHIAGISEAEAWLRRLATFEAKISHFVAFFEQPRNFPQRFDVLQMRLDDFEKVVDQVQSGVVTNCFKRKLGRIGLDRKDLVSTAISTVEKSFLPFQRTYAG